MHKVLLTFFIALGMPGTVYCMLRTSRGSSAWHSSGSSVSICQTRRAEVLRNFDHELRGLPSQELKNHVVSVVKEILDHPRYSLSLYKVLSKHIDRNVIDEEFRKRHGLALLPMAALNNRTRLVRRLMQHPQTEYKDKSAALFVAQSKLCTEILTDYGTDAEVRSLTDKTPLHCAAMAGRLPVMKVLVKKGARVNLQDNHGNTALYCATAATMEGDRLLKSVRFLLKHKAQPNLANNLYRTPLHNLAYQSHVPQIEHIGRALLDADADIHAQDNGKQTVLHLTAMHDSTLHLTALLLARGSLVDMLDKQGHSPVMLAEREYQKALEACQSPDISSNTCQLESNLERAYCRMNLLKARSNPAVANAFKLIHTIEQQEEVD